MSNNKDTKKEVNEEEAEEYLVKYKSGPTRSDTKNGNIYNINIQIGQPPNPPPPPPYKP